MNGFDEIFWRTGACPNDQLIRLDFGDDPNHNLDPGIFQRIHTADSIRSVLFTRWEQQSRRRFALYEPLQSVGKFYSDRRVSCDGR